MKESHYKLLQISLLFTDGQATGEVFIGQEKCSVMAASVLGFRKVFSITSWQRKKNLLQISLKINDILTIFYILQHNVNGSSQSFILVGKKSNYVIRLFETWGRNKIFPFCFGAIFASCAIFGEGVYIF